MYGWSNLSLPVPVVWYHRGSGCSVYKYVQFNKFLELSTLKHWFVPAAPFSQHHQDCRVRQSRSDHGSVLQTREDSTDGLRCSVSCHRVERCTPAVSSRSTVNCTPSMHIPAGQPWLFGRGRCGLSGPTTVPLVPCIITHIALPSGASWTLCTWPLLDAQQYTARRQKERAHQYHSQYPPFYLSRALPYNLARSLPPALSSSEYRVCTAGGRTFVPFHARVLSVDYASVCEVHPIARGGQAAVGFGPLLWLLASITVPVWRVQCVSLSEVGMD